ncbi:class I SAM-dependent methyltransferase, partial [Candidatus Pelagibacter bacterium]|nr:class I SAM-dependent methyltransferase [Candidatus Pelagibacter bacterium]
IGCDDDYAFSKIDVDSKIGVDPYSGGNFKGTSDNFFLQNKEKFDCIFIDGLHEYDQVCRDIHNSLKFLKENGVIFLHDCLPPNIHQQAVPRYKATWNGDVWKAVVKYRTSEEYDIVTCKIDQGISIIRKKKNLDILKLKIDNFEKLTFKDFYYNYESYMRIIDYNKIFGYLE